jgi:predicted small lipoprotein YifL
MKFSQLLLLLIVYSALAGCGQPGPLYLPSKAPPVKKPLQRIQGADND